MTTPANSAHVDYLANTFAATEPETPAGFEPLEAGGPFIQHHGPLYVLRA